VEVPLTLRRYALSSPGPASMHSTSSAGASHAASPLPSTRPVTRAIQACEAWLAPLQRAARTPTAQQHDDLAATGRPSPGRTVLRAPVFSAGWLAIRFLISAAMVINASPTLVAFLALVSRKGMPISSAKALAVA